VRVGYLGPPGTFSHAALLAAPALAGAEPVAHATEREAILAAADGAVDAALVPIENSLEGGVNATLDTLAFDAPGLSVVAEVVLPVRHALIARPGVQAGDITRVVSHPQPLGQCRRYLAEALPDARTAAAASTAEAVRTVADAPEQPWAAIGPQAAAELYGCVVLADGIEDESGNETRFWLVAREAELLDGERAVAPGRAKTSVLFRGAGDTSPGWLVECLSELASRGINLTRIESRPQKRRLGHYLFLVDLEGHVDDPPVAEAIARLRARCEEVRVLGSYAAAA
jgi:prephenate dehydratase